MGGEQNSTDNTMYAIVGAEVNPMDGYGNDPEMIVGYTGTLPFDYDCYDEVGGHYVCVKSDGRVHHIAKTNWQVPDDGFGGRKFVARMRDGSVREWVGGWHTALPKDSPLTPYVEITWKSLDNPYSHLVGRLTLEKATELLERYSPDYELYYRELGWWTVKRKNEAPKNA